MFGYCIFVLRNDFSRTGGLVFPLEIPFKIFQRGSVEEVLQIVKHVAEGSGPLVFPHQEGNR